ncbi:MAG: alpha/beta hydrolase [Gammaproteobacteria bacterium]|nr:alpha/beta hydrolase [Gammaproteobacteria bacterium]
MSHPVNEANLHTIPRPRKTPCLVTWLKWCFAVLNRVSPRWGARLAYRLWFTSPRFDEPERERRWREKAHSFFLPHEHGPLAVYQWGQGPAVVLVHGWSGRGAQLGAFAQPLVQRGFSVVAFDAPGHGQSQGKQTNVFEVAAALAAVAEKTGPVCAIIAHSFGTMATTLAIQQGLQLDKIVCISAPTSGLFLVESFCETFALSQTTMTLFKHRLEKEFGTDLWQRIASDQQVTNSRIPALIIHDKDDRDVPWQWSEHLAKAWPSSHLWLTHGLGHRRILRNPAVVDAVSEFIVSGQLPKEALSDRESP